MPEPSDLFVGAIRAVGAGDAAPLIFDLLLWCA